MSQFSFLDKSPSSPFKLDDDLSEYRKHREDIRNGSVCSSSNTSIGVFSLGSGVSLTSRNDVKNDPNRKVESPDPRSNSTDRHTSLQHLQEKISKYETSNRGGNQVDEEREKIERLLSGKRESVVSNVPKPAEKPNVTAHDDIFAVNIEPQTPRCFQEALDSFHTEERNLSELFLARNKDDIAQLLEADAEKFNKRSFLQQSSVSNFSGPHSFGFKNDGASTDAKQLSIGGYFGQRNDHSIGFFGEAKEDSLVNPQDGSRHSLANQSQNTTGSTMRNIQNLLSEPGLSTSGICKRLMNNGKDSTKKEDFTLTNLYEPLEALNISRIPTPQPAKERRRASCNDTPVKRGAEWQKGRLMLSSSTPKLNSNSDISWHPLRQSRVESSDSGDGTLNCGNSRIESRVPEADISVLSHIVEEGERRNLTLDRSRSYSALLTVIKKISEMTGPVDCRALTSLIKREFPDEAHSQSIVSTKSYLSTVKRKPTSKTELLAKLEDAPIRVAALVRINKLVGIPIHSNQQWVILSLTGVDVTDASKTTTKALFDGDSFSVLDMLTVRCQDVALPPEVSHSIEVSVLSQKIVKIGIRLHFVVKDLLTDKSHRQSAYLRFTANLPSHEFSFSPPSPLDFGTIPEDCHRDRILKLTYVGDCQVPLRIYLTQETEQPHFKFCKYLLVNGEDPTEVNWSENSIEVTIDGGEKQVIELKIRFHPQCVQNLQLRGIVELEESVKVELLMTGAPAAFMQRTSVKGSAAYAKFLCRSDCSPFVFNAKYPELTLTRSFYMKNSGAIPLEVRLGVVSDLNQTVSSTTASPFIFPKKVAIPLNEEVSFDITFKGRPNDECVKRYLLMNLEPNGRFNFDVELIGTVSGGSISCARSMKSLATTASSENRAVFNGVPPKLTASITALSWPATPLQQPSVQSFQVKLKCTESCTARISFTEGSDAFKVINERGEALSKHRRSLKPGVSTTINVRFKPSSVQLYTSILQFEITGAQKISKISLTGYGGCPKLRIEETQTDFNGHKMVTLRPQADESRFTAQFRITNYGVVPGFILIQVTNHVLSLAQSFKVFPEEYVIAPNSNIYVNITHHLSRTDLKDIFSLQDFQKIATLSIVMGDEPSRRRLKAFMKKSSTPQCTELLSRLSSSFNGEDDNELIDCNESDNFPSVFLKSLKPVDVVVIAEKRTAIGDQTLLDLDETDQTFYTVMDSTVVQPMRRSDVLKQSESANTSYESAKSNNLNSKVENWLKNVK